MNKQESQTMKTSVCQFKLEREGGGEEGRIKRRREKEKKEGEREGST